MTFISREALIGSRIENHISHLVNRAPC